MKCIILAAGYGTRLYPLTLAKPKAFVDINGKPLLDHITEKIDKIKHVNKIIIVTNNKFYSDFDEWKKEAPTKKPIVVINDNTNSNEERLGALGDLLFGMDAENVDEDIILVASDNLFDFDLQAMAGKPEKDLVGVCKLDKDVIRKKYGVLELEENGKIIGFQEKPAEPKTNLASTGIYIFRKETLPLIRKYREESQCMEGPGKFVEWLHNEKDVYGHIFKGRWFDIGSIEELEKAKKEFEG